METTVSYGKIWAKIYLGEEVYEGTGHIESMAVQQAGYRALVNTMYAFKEIPEELVDFVKRKEKGTLSFDL